jgi:hypothetical protein
MARPVVEGGSVHFSDALVLMLAGGKPNLKDVGGCEFPVPARAAVRERPEAGNDVLQAGAFNMCARSTVRDTR